jgi:hypothetical protein
MPCTGQLALLVVALAAVAGAADANLLLPAIPYVSVPQAGAAAVIDGRLDDACWQGAAHIQVFHPALRPETLGEADASQAGEALGTEAWLTWRPEALLVAFHCHDSRVLATPARPRDDQLYTEDVVEMFLDPIGDGRRYWEIQVSPLGQITDAVHVITAEPPPTPTGRLPADFYVRNHICSMREDLPGIVAAAAITVDGWTVEVAIPVAVLPRTAAGAGVFAPGLMRLNLVRYDWDAPLNDPKRQLHQASWSAVEQGCPHQSAGRMGWLMLEGM